MTYKLLTSKLEREKGKFITRESLKTYSKTLDMDYNFAIGYLLANGYIIRILRGIFYVKSLEERKLGKLNINYLEAIKEALAIKGVKNWYFGLETAFKLNALTHEYFTIDYVISDTIYRPKPFDILGHNIRFIKAKKSLLNFGITSNAIPYSDPEKTILDMIYLGKYNNKPESEIKDKIASYLDSCNKKKLLIYVKHYPKSVEKIVRSLL